MVKSLGFLLFVTILFLVGVCCLLCPDKVQVIAIKAVNWGLPSKVEAINSYMRLVDKFVRSNRYLIVLRMIGTISLLCSVFLLWMFIKNLRNVP
jgi:hypothetical protein